MFVERDRASGNTSHFRSEDCAWNVTERVRALMFQAQRRYGAGNLIVSQIMAVVTIKIMRDKDPRKTPLKVAYSPFRRDPFVGQGVGQVFQS